GNIEYLGRIDHQVKIRGHRIELGEIDSHVLSYSEAIKNAVTEVKEHDGDKSLVVYYVSSIAIDKESLSAYLGSRLPQYMVPVFYVSLESIPLTVNGKIDRQRLPSVGLEDVIRSEYVSPENEEQRVLSLVWEQVLKHSPVSIRDNYYNLGGDSIKSIQIVSRLRQHGYSLKVEHILQYPVLDDLSKHMIRSVVSVDQSAVDGASILTPIQRYFFESSDIVDKNHYNQSVILKSSSRLSGSDLELSLKDLVFHHDALRMVYRESSGEWSQYNAGSEGSGYRFSYFDIRSDTAIEEAHRLRDIGEVLQGGIDISSGVLLHACHVSMSDGDRLILVIHHLVVDGVSWRILLEDLGELYACRVEGRLYSLPEKTDSFQRWGDCLSSYSVSPVLLHERGYWESVESEFYPLFPTDYPVGGKHILDQSLGFTLSEDSTRAVQTRAGKHYGAEINDILLTCLALSLDSVLGVGKSKVLLEGHGREDLGLGVDVSRTVGWFTSVYPFSLDITGLDEGGEPSIVRVKESLRRIPHKGIGYGILHYLNGEIPSGSKASILFNYLGDFNEIMPSSSSVLSYSSEDIGSAVSDANLLTDILLDVSGMTVNGEMSIHIRYSDKVYNESTISRLLSSYQSHLEDMISESSALWDKRILTPSDFTYKGLSFSTVESVSSEHDIEDLYELSPMQQGLYYHWLLDPSGSTYFMQTSYRIKGMGLNVSHVESAFSFLLNRYTILRTSFTSQYGDHPLQLVHREARVDFSYSDLSGKGIGYAEEELAKIKGEDISRGFMLNECTQMRLHVVLLDNGYYEFIWSHHHIIMDGWCLGILINDFT
ncbi:condensation domain-containing protein, partial [Chryseobacterium sp. ON_d1]|uniref:condensation domain-containing protein n=1 Tax=Chryseobacterium sp. ON_d1 TaxID=2583211 RepID=UPI001E5FEB9A